MGIGSLSRPAVFLDRDGVINRAIVRNGLPYPPRSVEELEVLPGVPEALARLRGAGFQLIVVTNQPDVARERQTREAVEAMHTLLCATLPIDGFQVCFHDDSDGCDCRKPKPGLLQQAARQCGIELAGSFMVGDRWRDIEAGRQAGCRTVLVEYKYAEGYTCEPDARVGSLAEAADWILAWTELDPGVD